MGELLWLVVICLAAWKAVDIVVALMMDRSGNSGREPTTWKTNPRIRCPLDPEDIP